MYQHNQTIKSNAELEHFHQVPFVLFIEFRFKLRIDFNQSIPEVIRFELKEFAKGNEYENQNET